MLSSTSPAPPSYEELMELERGKNIQPVSRLRIVVLLDASGSMQSTRMEAIGAVNSFVKKQQESKTNDEVFFDLFTFNADPHHVIIGKPLDAVMPIPPEEYITSGSTSLYDTVGYVLDFYREDHDILLVVMTDGCDTSSKKHTNETIKPLLAQRKVSPFDWEVIWLGADPTITQIGSNLGISASASVNFKMLREYSDEIMSSAVTEYRKEKAVGKKKAIDLKTHSV